jgi:hypothetical protein
MTTTTSSYLRLADAIRDAESETEGSVPCVAAPMRFDLDGRVHVNTIKHCVKQCRGCPVLSLCQDYLRAELRAKRVPVGVMAGRRFGRS